MPESEGGNETTETTATTHTQPTTETGTTTTTVTSGLSQAEVDEFVGKRLGEATRKTKQETIAEIATMLGVKPEELKDVPGILKQVRDAEEAKKDELQREREAREALEKDSTAKITAAQQSVHNRAVQVQLLLAGVPLPEDAAEKQEALSRLGGFINLPVGASDEEIAADIEKLKGQFPALFTAPEAPRATPNPPSNPSGTPRGASLGDKSPADRGRERANRANAKRGVTTPTA